MFKDYILQDFNVGFTEWQIFSKVWKVGVYPVGQHRAVLDKMQGGGLSSGTAQGCTG